jgi:TolA-binding protein
MITQEMIQQQEALAGLTDAQREAIITLSKNDEEAVIGARFREVYNRLDETIARETGIARDGDEKTYNYLERAARQLAGKANSVEGLNTKIHDLTAERDRLKKAIEENTGDEKLKKDLAQAIKDLDSVKTQYNTLKADYDKQKSDHATELENFRIDNEIASVKGGIKFKADLPETATNVLMEQAISKVKGFNHEFIDDGNGGKRLVFKDANDAIMRNAEKQLEPFTIGDLLTKELKTMGVLDEGRQQQGGGTHAPKVTHTQDGIVIDLSGARTQVEAQEMIAQTLMKQGLINGSSEFQEASTKAWKENNCQALPFQ